MTDKYYNLIEKGDSVFFCDKDGEHIGKVVGFKLNNTVVVEHQELCYDKPSKELQVL